MLPIAENKLQEIDLITILAKIWLEMVADLGIRFCLYFITIMKCVNQSDILILLAKCTHHNWEVFKNVWTNPLKLFWTIWGTVYVHFSSKNAAKMIQEIQKLIHTTLLRVSFHILQSVYNQLFPSLWFANPINMLDGNFWNFVLLILLWLWGG